MKDERTSKRVAKIAGQLLKALGRYKAAAEVLVGERVICTVGELKALAASALTQTVDKKK